MCAVITHCCCCCCRFHCGVQISAIELCMHNRTRFDCCSQNRRPLTLPHESATDISLTPPRYATVRLISSSLSSVVKPLSQHLHRKNNFIPNTAQIQQSSHHHISRFSCRDKRSNSTYSVTHSESTLPFKFTSDTFRVLSRLAPPPTGGGGAPLLDLVYYILD